MLPNVLCIGAQKCGTTALYRRFAEHPDCAVCPDLKEPHFFISEGPWPIGNWHRGVEWYEGLFPAAPVVADVCPSYAASPVYPRAAERAHSVVPEATIVYLVRDPIDRIVSHWMHFRSRGYERRPLVEAALAPGEANEYLAGSRYAAQLELWLEHYPRERVLAMHQRDLAAGRDDELWSRLGVSAPGGTIGRWNVSEDLTEPGVLDRLPGPLGRVLPASLRRRPIPRPELDPDTRSRLHDRLDADIARFQSLGGVALEGWPES